MLSFFWYVEKIKKVKIEKLQEQKAIGRIILLSVCVVCDSKKSNCVKEQRVSFN